MDVGYDHSADRLRPQDAEAIKTRTPRPTLSKVAFTSARWTGSVQAGAIVTLLFLTWMVVGVATGFPRWWELTVTIGVPIVSLFLLIVVQHTQSHANRATHLKLDELLHASERATNHLISVEDASESDLDRMQDVLSPKSPDALNQSFIE